jgi:hypothetical protein
MTMLEHNNATSGPPVGEPRAPKILALKGLISFIDAGASIPASQKRYLRSALNRAHVLAANGLADIRADPKDLLRRLDRLSPAMAGMTPRSWTNLKSRVRSALRHAAPYLAPARSSTRLTGEWAALEARLQVREQRQLSPFLRFLQGMGRAPGEIGEEDVDRFEAYLEHEVIRADFQKVIRATRRVWNRAADSIPGWPDRRLAPPDSRHIPYWLPLDQLPASLQQEIEDYLHRLAHPDPFLGPGGKALASTTIGQFRVLFVSLASALVGSGTPADEVASIRYLVHPGNFERALRFLYARAGHRVNHVIYRAAYRARKIAAQTGLPEQDLARLDHILASVKREYPAEPGLTPQEPPPAGACGQPRVRQSAPRLSPAARRGRQDGELQAVRRELCPGRGRGRVAADLQHARRQPRNPARRPEHPPVWGGARRPLDRRPPSGNRQESPAPTVRPAARIRAAGRVVLGALAPPLGRTRCDLAVPRQARGARRSAAAHNHDQEARAQVRWRRDHLSPISPSRRRTLPQRGPRRARGGEPASGAPQV